MINKEFVLFKCFFNIYYVFIQLMSYKLNQNLDATVMNAQNVTFVTHLWLGLLIQSLPSGIDELNSYYQLLTAVLIFLTLLTIQLVASKLNIKMFVQPHNLFNQSIKSINFYAVQMNAVQ